MSTLTKSEQEILNCLPATTKEIAEQIDVTESTVRSAISRMRVKGWDVQTGDDGYRYLAASPTDAPVSLAKAQGAEKSVITRRANEHRAEMMEWLDDLLERGTPPASSEGMTFTPGNVDMIVHRTDVHIGAEVFDEFGNPEYNWEILRSRENRIIEETIAKKNELEAVGRSVDTLHILAGGDWVTGENIYFAQPHEIEFSLDVQIDLGAELLYGMTARYAQEFPHVQLICQSGNHGEIRGAGFSEQFNCDDLVYATVERLIRVAGLDNVTVVRKGGQYFSNFYFRGGRWKGHLRHGQKSSPHIGTKAPQNWWGRQLMKHQFDIAFRGHYHETRIEPIPGHERTIFVVETGSIVPPGDYEEGLAVGATPSATIVIASDANPVETLHFIEFTTQDEDCDSGVDADGDLQ